MYHDLLWLQAWNVTWNMSECASAFFIESQNTGLIYFKHKPRSDTDRIPPTPMTVEIEVMAQRLRLIRSTLGRANVETITLLGIRQVNSYSTSSDITTR